MAWFCKHNWRLEDKEVREPAVKTLDNTTDARTHRAILVMPALTVGAVIYLLICKKCGKYTIESRLL